MIAGQSSIAELFIKAKLTNVAARDPCQTFVSIPIITRSFKGRGKRGGKEDPVSFREYSSSFLKFALIFIEETERILEKTQRILEIKKSKNTRENSENI